MARLMRVGLNLLFLGEQAGGIGRLALELLAALAARDDIELEVFANRRPPVELLAAAEAGGVRVTRVPQPPGPLRPLGEYALLPVLARARGVDVLHSLGNAGPVCLPGIASAVTVHDVIWRRAGDAWADAPAQRSMDRVVGRVARRADAVLTGSHDSAADLVAELAVPTERVTVIHHGVAPPSPHPADARARFALGDGPVLLCVAQMRPYKNQAGVVRALAALEDPAAMLVLPGALNAYAEELRELAGALGVGDRVLLPGWVTDAELEGLYEAAAVVVLPSLIEGFGLPVLEAMIRGTPVVCSDTTALAEVAGDAALTVDPEDQAAIDAAVARVLDDGALRADLAARGRARAAAFTWARCADGHVAAYRAILRS